MNLNCSLRSSLFLFPTRMTVLLKLSSVVLYLFFFVLHSTIQRLFAWNFSEVGLPQNVLIWRFTIWRNRAYLAVPRWNKKPQKQPFTLLEAPWPEAGNSLHFGISIPEVSPYPDGKSQEEGVCENLQSVTGLDSDSRGRLWVLDAPASNQCNIPKILIFDLRRNEKIIETELRGVSSRGLKCLIVDPIVGQRGVQAYVSDPGDGSMIVYSLAEKNWRRIELSGGLYTKKTISTQLAVSRKNSTLYLTGYPSDDLFSIDLESIRNDGAPFVSPINDSNTRDKTNLSWVGYKMGSSSGLISDLRGGIHYFMVTEIASVRWDSRLKLEAEGHAILLQSELVPSITDYTLDSQKNVWGIVNERYPFRNPTKNDAGWKNSKMKRRTVKLYKYNPFIL